MTSSNVGRHITREEQLVRQLLNELIRESRTLQDFIRKFKANQDREVVAGFNSLIDEVKGVSGLLGCEGRAEMAIAALNRYISRLNQLGPAGVVFSDTSDEVEQRANRACAKLFWIHANLMERVYQFYGAP